MLSLTNRFCFGTLVVGLMVIVQFATRWDFFDRNLIIKFRVTITPKREAHCAALIHKSTTDLKCVS